MSSRGAKCTKMAHLSCEPSYFAGIALEWKQNCWFKMSRGFLIPSTSKTKFVRRLCFKTLNYSSYISDNYVQVLQLKIPLFIVYVCIVLSALAGVSTQNHPKPFVQIINSKMHCFSLGKIKSKARVQKTHKSPICYAPSQHWHPQVSLQVNVKFMGQALNHSESVGASVVRIIQRMRTPSEEDKEKVK